MASSMVNNVLPAECVWKDIIVLARKWNGIARELRDEISHSRFEADHILFSRFWPFPDGSRISWYVKAPRIAPMMGAIKYSHWCSQFPLMSAGPNERAGFMDAPLIGPPHNAFTMTLIIAASCPTAFVSVNTAVITNISAAVRITFNGWFRHSAVWIVP